MKKMKKNRNKEANELIMALKMAAACAIEFIAIIVAIPAKIMLGISKWLAKKAVKLAGGRPEIIQQTVISDETFITEIIDA